MISRNYKLLLSVILLTIIVLTSCESSVIKENNLGVEASKEDQQTNQLNNKEKNDPNDDQQMEETIDPTSNKGEGNDKDQEYINPKYIESIMKNVKVKKLETGKEIKTYIYSPDKKNYFLEVKTFIYGDPIGNMPLLYLYFNNEYLTTVQPDNNSIRYQFRNNISPQIVKWINNEEAIIVDMINDNMYVLNVTNKKKKILLELEAEKAVSYDYNRGTGNIVYILQTLRNIYYGLDNIGNIPFKNIFYDKDYLFFDNVWLENIVWGKDGNIYLDTYYADKVIKRYDYNTKEISDYKENAYILNISPNQKYLAYIDIDRDLTIIKNVEKNLEFELPKSEELVWINDNQFATVENNKHILINTIEGDTLNTQKYDIGNWLKDKEQVYNLQYINNKLRFDAILLWKDGKHVLGIEKVTTYEIQ